MHQEEEQKKTFLKSISLPSCLRLTCSCCVHALLCALHTKRWKITNRIHSLNVTLIWNWWDFYAIAGESINVRFSSTWCLIASWVWCIISIRFDAYLLLQKQQIHYKHSTHYKRMPLYNYNYATKQLSEWNATIYGKDLLQVSEFQWLGRNF